MLHRTAFLSCLKCNHRHRTALGAEKYTCRVRICFEVSFAFEEFLLREEMSL